MQVIHLIKNLTGTQDTGQLGVQWVTRSCHLSHHQPSDTPTVTQQMGLQAALRNTS